MAEAGEDEFPEEGDSAEEPEDDEDLDNEDLEPEAYPADAQGNDWDYDDEEDKGEEDEMTVNELKDAYAAGWRAKSQSAEMRKGRGYKGQSKGKNCKERPPDMRKVEDRKKSSKCAACGKLNMATGEEMPFAARQKVAKCRRGSAGSASRPSSVKEEPGTIFTTKEEDESPRRGEDRGSMKVHRVNWTYMVGTGWDLLGDYVSDDEEESSSSSEELACSGSGSSFGREKSKEQEDQDEAEDHLGSFGTGSRR